MIWPARKPAPSQHVVSMFACAYISTCVCVRACVHACVCVCVCVASQVKDPTKFGGKKSKAAAKTGTAVTQWGILKQSGIPEDQIPEFRYVTVRVHRLEWVQMSLLVSGQHCLPED